MQRWLVISWALLALVGADQCPDGRRCGDGQTCCNDPANGYECCPFDQAECCGDHMHCCPAGTVCHAATSRCLNSTGSIPWVERATAAQPGLSKSFRMIKTYMGEEDNTICPDQSRCPPEFSCMRALTKYGCCPLAQGVPCSDGKHCCPEGHKCSADGRSCNKKEVVTIVLCSDGLSECPDETTCCETAEGKWGCCPMPRAVCCEDKTHCCPEGSSCDVDHSKCISLSTKKETPMWAKLPARMRADWENQKGHDIPCNDTESCPDDTTCCKNQEGEWSCCPLPEAVCCDDHEHCCPSGTTCDLTTFSCNGASGSTPMKQKFSAFSTKDKKVPTILREDAQVGKVACDSTHACPDGSTCCKTKTGEWACCPLPEAVCCDDHEHCCPSGTICDLTTLSCNDTSGSNPMKQKFPAFTTMLTASANTKQTGKPERDEEEEEESIQCDPHTSCPHSTTCCFMTSTQKWGCCPLPQAVCCADGNHCCPTHYKCDESKTTCIRGEVEIPWYTKLPATIMLGPSKHSAVPCDEHTSCPDGETCCRTSATTWGCCPSPNAVCCSDMVHCCPTGYTCTATGDCIQNARLQWHHWHMFLANKKKALIV